MEAGKWKAPRENNPSGKLATAHLRLVGQTVQSGQLGQLGEAAVVDAEVQVLVQDAEILIAALDDPAAALQMDQRQFALAHEEHCKTSWRRIQVGCLFTAQKSGTKKYMQNIYSIDRWTPLINQLPTVNRTLGLKNKGVRIKCDSCRTFPRVKDTPVAP